MKWTPIVAMICITGLLAYALSLGIDGVILAGGCTVIAGLGGYEIKVLQNKRKGGK